MFHVCLVFDELHKKNGCFSHALMYLCVRACVCDCIKTPIHATNKNMNNQKNVYLKKLLAMNWANYIEKHYKWIKGSQE